MHIRNLIREWERAGVRTLTVESCCVQLPLHDAARLAALGAGVVDTDRVAHALTAPGGAAMPALAAAFGPEIVQADGAMDRAAMRARVFADPQARQQLEAILHPMIRVQTEAELATCPGDYLVLVVPLLVETGTYLPLADRVLVVDCPVDTQRQRVRRQGQAARGQHAQPLFFDAAADTRQALGGVGADFFLQCAHGSVPFLCVGPELSMPCTAAPGAGQVGAHPPKPRAGGAPAASRRFSPGPPWPSAPRWSPGLRRFAAPVRRRGGLPRPGGPPAARGRRPPGRCARPA